jgi:hypothetical protein
MTRAAILAHLKETGPANSHTVAIRKATAASSAAAVERKQAGAPRVESATRPDTGAFIAANPQRFEVLPSFLDRRRA